MMKKGGESFSKLPYDEFVENFYKNVTINF